MNTSSATDFSAGTYAVPEGDDVHGIVLIGALQGAGDTTAAAPHSGS